LYNPITYSNIENVIVLIGTDPNCNFINITSYVTTNPYSYTNINIQNFNGGIVYIYLLIHTVP